MKSEEKIAVEDEMNLYIEVKDCLKSIIKFDYPEFINYQFIKNAKYENFCYLVDRYVVMNEISVKQAIIIKKKVKSICNIKNKDDKLNTDFFFDKKIKEDLLKEVITKIIRGNNEIRNKPIINLNEFINEYDKKILRKKFKISIEDRLYSENECADILYVLISYSRTKNMSEGERLMLNELPSGVSRKSV